MGILAAVSETAFNRCGTKRDGISEASVVLAKLTTVSVPVQNAGGDLDQPIGRTKGIAISCLSPSLVGNRTPSRIESSGFSTYNRKHLPRRP